MFSSIRYKLLFFMILNILIFAIFLYGFNSIFAEKYYIKNKKNILIENSNKIKNIIKDIDISGGEYDESVNYEIKRLEKNIGGVINIGKIDGTLYFPSSESSNSPPPSPENPFFITDENLNNSVKPADFKKGGHEKDIKIWEIYKDGSFFIKLKDPHLKIETLRFQTHLGDELTLLIWVPMNEISQSVSILNTFTQIITILTIFIAVILAFFISKTFTKPITEINNITKKISHLDFTETLKINGKDEISELSNSINYLSQKLNTAIFELNIKNQKLKNDIDSERKLDKMRKEFVSNVSHELKTPIFLIQGYAEGLKKNVIDSEEKRNFYCDVIIEESDKMDILVKDLLNLSALQSENLSINRINFNIEEVLKDIIGKMETVLKDNNVNITLEGEKQITVNADPVKIEQIIINFLNNAINHLDKNKKIIITLLTHNNKVRVSVFNTGKHIPAKFLDKIWTSFYKIDEARSREYGGTGLGLSIVKAIQKAHKNDYGVNNIKDGVEFWFDVDMI